MKRTSMAVWNGSLKDGNGIVDSTSKAFKNLKYSWNSRFAEGTGTNPEELIAAAHAACFSMALSAEIGKAGFAPEKIETSATINFENGTMTDSHLIVTAKIPGISNVTFKNCALEAKINCPVSRVLKLNVTMESTLL
jgi:osmotically inducible protein OsmC